MVTRQGSVAIRLPEADPTEFATSSVPGAHSTNSIRRQRARAGEVDRSPYPNSPWSTVEIPSTSS